MLIPFSCPVGESAEENPPAGGAASWRDATKGRARAEMQVRHLSVHRSIYSILYVLVYTYTRVSILLEYINSVTIS